MTGHETLSFAESRDRPVIFVVDDDLVALAAIERDLSRRFGRDYHIATASSPMWGVKLLESLADEGTAVALIAASLQMSEMTGPDFLDAGCSFHRDAKRILLVMTSGHGIVAAPEGFAELQNAIALGRVDFSIIKGWVSPEEWFYRQIQNALSDWAGANRPHKEIVLVVGHQWDRATHNLRDMLDRNVVPYGYYNADSPEARGLLDLAGATGASLPVAIFEEGYYLVQPTTREIADALAARTHPGDTLYDVIILGAGPAGLSSAVYATSEGLSTLVVEPQALGGQAGSSPNIRNYLGFPQGASGHELTARAYEQARLFGAQFLFMREATALHAQDGHYHVHLSDCEPARARSVIIAIGVRYRHLGIPELDRLIGAGVYYGSASLEAPAMAGKSVYVVGGANSAGQAAVHLARYADRVTMLVRGRSLESDMSQYLIEQIRATPNIDIRFRQQIVGANGEQRLETLTIEDLDTGEQQQVDAAAVFLLIGAESCAGWLEGTLEMDDRGYIQTGRDVSPGAWPLDRPPHPFETSLPGVFAVGDARYRAVKRVAAAVGEGSVAVGSVHHWLAQEQIPQDGEVAKR